MPGVDARLFITPPHLADRGRDPRRPPRPVPQQLSEHGPYLRHGHGRRFFPPSASAPVPGTTGLTATASCGGASRPTTVLHNGPAPLHPSLRPATPPPGAARHAPAPTPGAAPPWRC